MNRAPLDASDPERAGALKRKVLARLTDVTRHYRALQVATQEFGEGFDRTEFVQAAESEDPIALNRVKAVERGLDQLFNYVAELSVLGLQLAGIRLPGDDANARADLRQLRDLEVLGAQPCNQLVRVAGIRNRMVHDYVGVAAANVHEAVRLLRTALPGFVSGYQDWVRAGFAIRD